jgi:hypothetical protein
MIMNYEDVQAERYRQLTVQLTELYTHYQSLGLDRLRRAACDVYSDIYLDSYDFKDIEDYYSLGEAMTEVRCWELENGFEDMDLYFDEEDR